ncbi:exo-alpha-sialidase [Taklimakanibacter lacteus]|uniref:exo-alpha-sialidase n=1 Tax=Taklimakanibacter lacteus TaxID=2268456 RepID=UPI0013C4D295
MNVLDTSGDQAMAHRLLHRDPFAYCAHPHLIAARPDNWLMVFTQSRRRDIVLHPPQDPFYCNMLMRSEDQGRSWTTPSIIPGFRWQGVECAGLTALRSGKILLNQWRFDWYPLDHARAHLKPEDYVSSEHLMGPEAMAAELSDWAPESQTIAERFPWARGGGETWIHTSDDGGRSFARSVRIDTAPFSGGYGMRGGVELPDGEVILPLCDVPQYRNVFIVRSLDSGESWSQAELVAGGEGHEFEEPAPLLLRSGRLIMLLRDNLTRILHLVHSDDGGRSWSAACATGIIDYPAHLLELPDGRIACVTGRRAPPFGITLHISEDEGETWPADRPIMVRSGLPNRDLGYPTMALRPDGDLFIAYYAQDVSGVTGIQASLLKKEVIDGRY